jgi:hypothetical protein
MPTTQLLEQWEQRLRALLVDYEHRVLYGNLRAQRTEWPANGGVVNFALVYELPGGSSSQLNIEYHRADNIFRFVDVESAEERQCPSGDAALGIVRDTITRIPERRLHRLREDIERWYGEGKSSHEMFLEINKLLQTDFKGGSLTHPELKAGIAYVLELGKQQAAG